MDTPSTGLIKNAKGIPDRWPRIRRYLYVEPGGGTDGDFARWACRVDDQWSSVELAAAYEEWADFFEWRLEQRAAELAGDRFKRHIVQEWTDSMAYCCRRSATCARGEDPGVWVPQWERRPDLHEQGKALLDEDLAPA